MMGRSFLSRFLRDRTGAGAAEFALVLPLAMLFLLGIIDAGRLFYDINRGEKTTQVGARWAVVTDPLAAPLKNSNYVGVTVDGVTLSQGDRVPQGALGLVTCTATSCTCTTAPCPGGISAVDANAFGRLRDRMREFMPEIGNGNIVVEYRGSGLGYAGNPTGMDVFPLVTVRLVGMTFSPMLLFGNEIDLPDFSYTLTMEDGAGDASF